MATRNAIYDGPTLVGYERQDGAIVAEDCAQGATLASWLDDGVPGVVGTIDGDVVTDKPAVIPPNDELFGLALLEHFEEIGWEVRKEEDEGPEAIPAGDGSKARVDELIAGRMAMRAFCPTGEGGGIDNSCSPLGGGGGGPPGSLSGVNISKWNPNHASAKAATAKIDSWEKMALAGDIEGLLKAAPKYGPNPNSYQKKTLEAHANLVKKYTTDKATQPTPQQTTPEEKSSGIASMEGWNKIGPQLGSNQGGTYLAPDGTKFYVKFPKSEGHAHSEVLASKLFEAAGANVSDLQMVKMGDKLGVASKWVDGGKPINLSDAEQRELAQSSFAVHAWLGNWDAVGTGTTDNIKIIGEGADAKAMATDVGGSLMYRAQGALKEPGAFGDEVQEWNTLRNPSLNPGGAKLFAEMTPQQLAESAAKVAAISGGTIKTLVDKHMAGADPAERAAMVNVLMNRRDKIAELGKAYATATEEKPQISDDEAYEEAGGDAAASESNPPAETTTQITIKPPSHATIVAAQEANEGDPDYDPFSESHKLNQQSSEVADSHMLMFSEGDLTEVDLLAMGYQLDVVQAAVNEKIGAANQTSDSGVTVTLPNGQKIEAIPPAAPAIPPPKVITSPTNAFHQKKLDMIFELAQEQDLAALLEMKTNANAKNPYSKMIHKYKLQVIEALKAGGVVVEGNEEAIAEAAKATKTAVVPKVNPALFPSKPQFVSSNQAQVKENQAIVDVIHELANKGDLSALQYVKLTGSPKLQQYHAEMVAALSEQLVPPPAAVPVSGKLKELAAKIPLAAGHGSQKVGKWLVVGDAGAIPEDLPTGVFGGVKAAWASGVAKYNTLVGKLKSAIYSYTGGGYHSINEALRSGTNDAKALAAAEAVMKIAEPLQPGMVLSRKHGGVGYAQLKGMVGKVLQDKAIMSTSTKDSVWSGSVQWELTVGHGVRGVPAKDFSASGTGESEVILPPNTRIMVTKVDKSGTTVKAKAVILPTHDSQCCPP